VFELGATPRRGAISTAAEHWVRRGLISRRLNRFESCPCNHFTSIMKKLIPLLSTFLISCDNYSGPKPVEIPTDIAAVENSDRFSVTRVSRFYDSDAYSQYRSVFVIKDNISKKEYVGISGIGISETGSHSDGEDTVKDER
jgi:hypothetical protein